MPRSLSRRSLLAASLVGTAVAQVSLPRKVRVGMIGLDGHTNEILNPLKQLPDVELVAVAAADPGAARRFKSQKVYDDYRKMLEAEQLDVVAICNNNGERAASILACVARKLNIIAEKPFATSMTELAAVRTAVERSGVQISTLLPMRFDPPYLALRQIVEQGRIGEVVQIAAQKSYKLGNRPAWFRKRATYGGTIAWIGIHMIDLMRFASGREFTEAFSYQARIGPKELGDMETVTASLFKLDNGGAATLRMDYFRPETATTHGDDRLRLAGTQGIAEYIASTGVVLLRQNAAPEVIKELPPAGSVFVDFLESVYLQRPARLPLADIWRVNEITLKTQQGADEGKVVRL